MWHMDVWISPGGIHMSLLYWAASCNVLLQWVLWPGDIHTFICDRMNIVYWDSECMNIISWDEYHMIVWYFYIHMWHDSCIEQRADFWELIPAKDTAETHTATHYTALQHTATHTAARTAAHTATHTATPCKLGSGLPFENCYPQKYTRPDHLHTATHTATHTVTHCNTHCNTQCNTQCTPLRHHANSAESWLLRIVTRQKHSRSDLLLALVPLCVCMCVCVCVCVCVCACVRACACARV